MGLEGRIDLILRFFSELETDPDTRIFLIGPFRKPAIPHLLVESPGPDRSIDTVFSTPELKSRIKLFRFHLLAFIDNTHLLQEF